MGCVLRGLGFSHINATAASEAKGWRRRRLQKFKGAFTEFATAAPPSITLEVWFQDEMRLGQKNGTVRQRAATGSSPRQPADQRYRSTCVFGAICPVRNLGVTLVLPDANTAAVQKHIDEISRHVAAAVLAVVVTDNAGWNKDEEIRVAENERPLFIPAGCPELKAVENIWRYLRQSFLSIRVFNACDHIADAACDAWKSRIAEAGRTASIATRTWVVAAGSGK